jgi:uncharacterized protein (DUF1684 family)
MLAAVLLLPAADPYTDEILRWRKARETALQAPDGWLSVAGLFWLREGVNTFGSAPDNAIVLPAPAPARAGAFELRDGQVSAVAGGTRRALEADSADALPLGPLRLSVIRRGQRYAIRLRDPDAPARRNFHGLRWFPPDPAWRITARFVPAPRKLPITNVLGMKEDQECPGYAEFTIAGAAIRLYPVLEPGAQELFFIFRDRTSGGETYGAGRYLYTPLPANGKVVLDFNKASNPPCAFTPFATCPLPPKENRMTIRVTAGEMNYGGH